MPKIKDLTGVKFGRLLALKTNGKDTRKKYLWLCKCDCGNVTTVSSDSLVQGKTKSCGCLHKWSAENAHTTHGENRRGKMTPEYGAWSCMKSRCTNPNAKQFKYYGGRGIKICKRWFHSFENFLSDMGRRPSSKHSLDRYPNINGDYKPSNCRWATKKEQSEGRRNVILIEFDGKRMILRDWARHLNIKYPALLAMYHTGKPFEKIILHYKKRNEKSASCGVNLAKRL